jgi:hypothetical protein
MKKSAMKELEISLDSFYLQLTLLVLLPLLFKVQDNMIQLTLFLHLMIDKTIGLPQEIAITVTRLLRETNKI